MKILKNTRRTEFFNRVGEISTLIAGMIAGVSAIMMFLILPAVNFFVEIPEIPDMTYFIGVSVFAGIPLLVGSISLLTSLYLAGKSAILAAELQLILNEKYGLTLTLEDTKYLVNNLEVVEDEAMSSILDIWLEEDGHHYHSPAVLFVKDSEYKMLSLPNQREFVTPAIITKIEKIQDFHNEISSDMTRPIYVKQIKEGTVIFSEKLRAQLFYDVDVELEEISQERFWAVFFKGDVNMIMNPLNKTDLTITVRPEEVQHVLDTFILPDRL